MMTYMKMSKIILIMYTMSMLMFVNQSSMLSFWVLMELNMITFILIISNNTSNYENLQEKSFLYFIVQSLGSLVYLLGVTMSPELGQSVSESLIIFSMILKMGLWPFHSWLFELTKSMSSYKSAILLTTQKIPMMLMLTSLSSDLTIMVLMGSLIFGSLMIWKSSSMKSTLISSSIYFSLWFWIFTQASTLSFALFLCNYFMVNLLGFEETSKTNFNMESSTNSSIKFTVLLLLLLVGLPPLSMFYLKVYAVMKMLELLSTTWILMLWMTGFLATMGYIKILLANLTALKLMFNTEKMSMSNANILIFTQILLMIMLSS